MKKIIMLGVAVCGLTSIVAAKELLPISTSEHNDKKAMSVQLSTGPANAQLSLELSPELVEQAKTMAASLLNATDEKTKKFLASVKQLSEEITKQLPEVKKTVNQVADQTKKAISQIAETSNNVVDKAQSVMTGVQNKMEKGDMLISLVSELLNAVVNNKSVKDKKILKSKMDNAVKNIKSPKVAGYEKAIKEIEKQIIIHFLIAEKKRLGMYALPAGSYDKKLKQIMEKEFTDIEGKIKTYKKEIKMMFAKNNTLDAYNRGLIVRLLGKCEQILKSIDGYVYEA